MKSNPEISIIVPSFNEEKNIFRCLDSILNQTFTNFEVICVDDNSTDSTFDIINGYASQDSRVRAFRNTGKGVSSARNFGIEHSRAPYIGFVDSDDFIQPQMYEFLLRTIKENELDMAVCRYDKTTKFVEKHFEYSGRECTCGEFVDFFDANFIEKNELVVTSACMKLIKKDFIKSCGEFKKYKIGEDTVFCSKLWTNTNRVFLVDLPLYNYYVNTQSVSYTKIWDEKWFDLIETRFISYENFLGYNESKISSFYLDRGMKLILSYRFNIKGTPNEDKFKKPLKDYFKKYIGAYIKCTDIKIKYKLSVVVFFCLPFLYKAFRKKNDSTL